MDRIELPNVRKRTQQNLLDYFIEPYKQRKNNKKNFLIDENYIPSIIIDVSSFTKSFRY